MSLFFDILGWIGMACLLGAYALVTAKILGSSGWVYQTLNLIGAACLMTYSYTVFAWPSVILNLIWVGIGIVGLSLFVRNRRRAGLGSEHANG